MSNEFRLISFVRHASAGRPRSKASRRFCKLGAKQPLLLHNEPQTGSVRLSDLSGQHVGYVAHEHAALVAEKLSSGLLLLCRTSGDCLCVMRQILIWSEGEPVAKKRKHKTGADENVE